MTFARHNGFVHAMEGAGGSVALQAPATQERPSKAAPRAATCKSKGGRIQGWGEFHSVQVGAKTALAPPDVRRGYFYAQRIFPPAFLLHDATN